MPSPFPGMDPWLEEPAIFPDFHNRFISELSAALNAVIPPPYFTAIGTRVVIESDSSERFVEPDVDVLKPVGLNGSHAPGSGGGVAAALEVQPVTVSVPEEEFSEWLLEVRTGEGDQRLVTSIEVLSRSNKRQGGEGRAEYVRKQREMRERGVNLVEMDFLRGGTHTTMVPLAAARQKAGPFDYHICVYRPEQGRDLQVYPIRLPQKLPPVAVPLLPEAAPVVADLQTVLDRCYDTGLYARRARYGSPCDPPLTPEQQAWADAILRDKGLK